MPKVDGVSSFMSLRSRAIEVNFSGNTLLIASMQDIIKSKKAAGRAQDKAVLPILEKVLKIRNNRNINET